MTSTTTQWSGPCVVRLFVNVVPNIVGLRREAHVRTSTRKAEEAWERGLLTPSHHLPAGWKLPLYCSLIHSESMNLRMQPQCPICYSSLGDNQGESTAYAPLCGELYFCLILDVVR